MTPSSSPSIGSNKLMERKELVLRDRIRRLLETYSLEEVLEQCDETPEDVLIFLYFEYGLKFPEEPM